MPSPTASLATLRPDLAGSFMEFDLAMDRAGFISHRVLPVFETIKASGTFGKIPIEQLLQNRDTARSPGSGYSRGKFTFGTDTFACEEHGAEEPIDDREAALYADYFNAEMVAAQRAFDAVLRNAEKRAAALLFNATTWTGAPLTTAITNEWDDKTNAVPIDDVEAAARLVYAGSGLWPNALIINRKVFRNLRLCDQIVNKAKAQNFVNVQAGAINESILAQVFDLQHIIVAGSSKNTANEGAAAAISPIWSDEYAMLARVAETNDVREPCVGRTFHWGEDGSQVMGTVETYRDETVRGDVVRVRHDVDEKVLYVEAAHLLSNVTT